MEKGPLGLSTRRQDHVGNEAAFELREDVKDTFSGGSTAVGSDTFDLKDALDKGNGFIVTRDPKVIKALDGYEALKRTNLGDAKAAKKGSSKGGKS